MNIEVGSSLNNRSHGQDYLHLDLSAMIYAVADGVSQDRCSSYASKAAATAFVEHLSLRAAEKEVKKVNSEFGDASTTLVGAYILKGLWGPSVRIASIGDSRFMHGDSERIIHASAPDKLKGRSNVLLTCLGKDGHKGAFYEGKSYKRVELYRSRLKAGQHVVLFTDGVEHNFTDERIQRVVAAAGTAQEAASALTTSGPDKDDKSVIVIRRTQ